MSKMAKSKTRRVGILTAGGDCPGLNAAIRAVGKSAVGEYGMELLGIPDGFAGLIENRWRLLGVADLSGILTLGGTLLRTSRVKPNRYELPDGTVVDMTGAAVESYRSMALDCLVCLGGGGTQKNALHLMQAGDINVITLPKTIDNDIWGTDLCFGFDTAVSIATEAIDRLHSTADSHRRIMVLEVMGNKSGWLALAAGVAGGADVVLIPEIPYDLDVVAESIRERDRRGKRFSIVAVAEGARPIGGADDDDVEDADQTHHVATQVSRRLEKLTGLEARVTVLGHVQRGGSPTPTDRLLATRVGTAATEALADGDYGVLIGVRGEQCVRVPLEKTAGKRRVVPLDHELVTSARQIGMCLGDE